MIYEFAQKPGFLRIGTEAVSLACNPAMLNHVFTLYDPQEGKIEEVADSCARVAYTRWEEKESCRWQAVVDEQLVVEIALDIRQNQARLSWKVLQEGPRTHLVSLRFEGLAAAVETDAHARIALPSHGGRIVNPATASDGQKDHRYNWILDSFGACAFAYTQGLVAALRVSRMDDMMTSCVGGKQGERYAQLGVLLRYRYTQQDASYRQARSERGLSEDEAPAYPIAREFSVGCSEVWLQVLPCPALPAQSGWVPGARFIHDQLPGKRSQLYAGRMVYKIYMGSPAQGVCTTWRQAGNIIRSVYEKTGGIRQLVYLVGFQNRGHDDGYPDVFTPNTGAGSVEELRALVEEAAQYKALISFHDNYDDAYKDSPAFDADWVARDNRGGLLKGGIWNGKQAYWISLPQYVQGRSEERIQKTLACYPFLRETYHLDVLTASVFRLDFRQDSPAGRQRDLQARIQLVNQFAQHGLDVSSEACGMPFLGAISYFWHMPRIPRSLYEGDHRIPLVTFLAHGKADYGGTHTDHPSEILDGLLYGGFFSNDVSSQTPEKWLTDAAFMLFMPLDRIRNEAPVAYEEENGWKRVRYESGAEIAVNFETLECRVDIAGQRLVENGTAMIPQQDGAWLVYLAWEEPYRPVCLRCGLPEGTRVAALPLGTGGKALSLVAQKEGLPLELPVGVAYRIAF